MKTTKRRYISAILAAGVWMNLSEFVRNELLLKHYWTDGFEKIGLEFPSAPINGAVWGIWALVFVTLLIWLLQRFDVWRSTAISWIFGFVLLWLAIWNLGVLPESILLWAVPWSLVEVYVAAVIGQRFMSKRI